jgi:hypothetical protein
MGGAGPCCRENITHNATSTWHDGTTTTIAAKGVRVLVQPSTNHKGIIMYDTTDTTGFPG